MAERCRKDPRIRFINGERGPKGGVCTCRNIGIDEARASLIVFLDSDDLLTPECLEQRVAAMEANASLDFAVFPCERFLKTPGDMEEPFAIDTLEGDLDRYLRWDVPWQTAGPVWRRDALKRLGGWDPALPSATDLDLGIRAIASGCNYLRFDNRDCFWRADPEVESITTHLFSDETHLNALPATFEKWRRLLDDAGLLTFRRKRLLAGLHFLVAEHWLRHGNVARAIEVWSSAYRSQLVWRGIRIEGNFVLRLRTWIRRHEALQSWVNVRRLRG